MNCRRKPINQYLKIPFKDKQTPFAHPQISSQIVFQVNKSNKIAIKWTAAKATQPRKQMESESVNQVFIENEFPSSVKMPNIYPKISCKIYIRALLYE